MWIDINCHLLSMPNCGKTICQLTAYFIRCIDAKASNGLEKQKNINYKEVFQA